MRDRLGLRSHHDIEQWSPLRWKIEMNASVEEQGFRPFEITVLNLSRTGCGVRAGFRLTPGRVVRIMIATFAPWRGRVVWTKELYAGIHFDQPIHASVLSYLVSRHPPCAAMEAADGSD